MNYLLGEVYDLLCGCLGNDGPVASWAELQVQGKARNQLHTQLCNTDFIIQNPDHPLSQNRVWQRGDHLNNRYQTQHGIIFNLLVCQLKKNKKSIYLLSVSSLILTKSTLNFVVLMNNENHAKLTAAGSSVIITITCTVVAPTALPVSTDPACRRATLVSPTLRK